MKREQKQISMVLMQTLKKGKAAELCESGGNHDLYWGYKAVEWTFQGMYVAAVRFKRIRWPCHQVGQGFPIHRFCD